MRPFWLAPGLAAAFLAWTPAAEACSCGCNRDVAAMLRATPVLFRGRVVAESSTGGERIYRFEVVSVYRGTLAARVSIRTNRTSAACGARFEPKAEVLVGAYECGGSLRTSLCTQVCMGQRMAEVERLLAACRPDAPCPPD